MTFFTLPCLILALIAGSFCARFSVEEGQVYVKAYWIRHGFSCANALKEQTQQAKNKWSLVKGYRFGLYTDPTLTDCALERARELGPVIREKIRKDNTIWFPAGTDESETRPLFVFSSALVRAMETALMNFPDDEVYVIPNIAEEGMSLDNMPATREKQMEKLGRLPDAEQRLRRLHFNSSWTQTALHESGDYTSTQKKADFTSFEKNFPHILADLVKRLPDDDQQRVLDGALPLSIVFVSHSGFMQSNLKCTGEGGDKGRKPYNNEVWLQHYVWDHGAEQPQLIPLACQWDVIGGQDQTDSGTQPLICDATVERCNHKPKDLIAQNSKICKEKGNPVCARH